MRGSSGAFGVVDDERGLHPVGHIKLAEDGRHVRLDGDAEVEAAGDLGVGEPLTDGLETGLETTGGHARTIVATIMIAAWPRSAVAEGPRTSGSPR